ncbi:MAG: hypothetical protein GX591_11830 [Planctomycetes bacterium]|nr:hypothetical protein [Planctomycetota bacterium]
MSRIVSSLILSIAMIPLTFGVWGVTAWLVALGYKDSSDFSWDFYAVMHIIATLVTLAFVYLYWLAVWRSTVRWTRSRAIRTLLAAAGTCGAGALVVLAMSSDDMGGFVGATTLGAFIAGLGWVVATTVLWRETTVEKAQRLRTAVGGGGGYVGPLLCPMCGYDMRGLLQARCPECGAEYTLDALLTANVEGIEPRRGTAAAE